MLGSPPSPQYIPGIHLFSLGLAAAVRTLKTLTPNVSFWFFLGSQLRMAPQTAGKRELYAHIACSRLSVGRDEQSCGGHQQKSSEHWCSGEAPQRILMQIAPFIVFIVKAIYKYSELFILDSLIDYSTRGEAKELTLLVGLARKQLANSKRKRICQQRYSRWPDKINTIQVFANS